MRLHPFLLAVVCCVVVFVWSPAQWLATANADTPHAAARSDIASPDAACYALNPVPTGPDYDRTWWSAAKERRLPVIGILPPPVKIPVARLRRNPPEAVRVKPVRKAAATIAGSPTIAIVGPGPSAQECTGMGGEHMTLPVLEVVRGGVVTVAHAGGHGVGGLFGSWSCDIYVAGIMPRRLGPDAHSAMCIFEPPTDGDIVALVRANDLNHARAVSAALATWGTPAAAITPATTSQKRSATPPP